MHYDQLWLLLWGLAQTTIAGSLFVALLAHFEKMDALSRLFITLALVGSVPRAYGFWTGMKFNPNFWDVFFMFGIAGWCVRYAITGIEAHHRIEQEMKADAKA